MHFIQAEPYLSDPDRTKNFTRSQFLHLIPFQNCRQDNSAGKLTFHRPYYESHRPLVLVSNIFLGLRCAFEESVLLVRTNVNLRHLGATGAFSEFRAPSSTHSTLIV